MDQLDAEGVIGKSHLSEIENGLGTPSRDKLVALVTRLDGNVTFFTDHLRALHIVDQQRRDTTRPRWDDPDLSVLTSRPASRARPADQPLLVVTNGSEQTELEKIDFPESSELLFRLPLRVLHADDSYEVDSEQITRTAIFRRTIQASQDGARFYRWWFLESTSMLTIKRIDIGVSTGGRINQVWRLGTTAYGVEIELDSVLRNGQSIQLQYYKVVDAVGVQPCYVQTDETVACDDHRIAVRFDDKPERVWYWHDMPGRTVPTPYSEQYLLEPRATGQFEKSFDQLTPGLSSGIAWEFREDQHQTGTAGRSAKPPKRKTS